MSNDKHVMVTRDSENRTPEYKGIDRLLESFFTDSPLFGMRRLAADASFGWAPAVDIRETDNDLVVYAALPGLTKKDVSLEVRQNTLVLTGRMKALGSDEDSWVRRELPRGEFYRAFTLPADVVAGKVTASMSDGILEVRLPKADEAKPRRVDIS